MTTGTALGNAAAAAGATGTSANDSSTGDAAALAAAKVTADKLTADTAAKAAADAAAKGTEEAAKVKAAADAAKAAETAELAKPFTDLKQLKLPDGVKVDENAMKAFLPLAGKLKLTAEQAQGLIEFSATSSAETDKAIAAAHDAAAKRAVETLKNDKDIGGAKFEASMKLAGQVIQKFGGKDLAEAINGMQLADGSMLGDNLVFAKLLLKFGGMLTEDQLGVTAPPATKTPANSDEAFHRALYDKSPTLNFTPKA